MSTRISEYDVVEFLIDSVFDLSEGERKLASLTIRPKLANGNLGTNFCFFLPSIEVAQAYADAITACRERLAAEAEANVEPEPPPFPGEPAETHAQESP